MFKSTVLKPKILNHVMMIGPDLDRKGGVSIYAKTLIKAQALSDLKIEYFGTVGNGSMQQRTIQMLKAQANFTQRLVKEPLPDLYHIFVADDLSLYRKLLYFLEVRATKRPIVIHGHFADLDRLYQRSKIDARAIKWFFTKANQVQVISSNMAHKVEFWTDGRANIRLIPNAVPLNEFPSLVPRSVNERLTVLFMGNVGTRKGVYDLMLAIPKILKEVPLTRFLIGGDGEVNQLKKLIKKQRIDKSVEVLGWVDGVARLNLFAESDVFCLPSYAEGLPISILEAMASGLPIVTTNVNGIPDAVLDGETGFMIEPGDIDDLSKRLVQLLKCAELRDQFGVAGRKRVKACFDSEVIATTIREQWMKLID